MTFVPRTTTKNRPTGWISTLLEGLGLGKEGNCQSSCEPIFKPCVTRELLRSGYVVPHSWKRPTQQCFSLYVSTLSKLLFLFECPNPSVDVLRLQPSTSLVRSWSVGPPLIYCKSCQKTMASSESAKCHSDALYWKLDVNMWAIKKHWLFSVYRDI